MRVLCLVLVVLMSQAASAETLLVLPVVAPGLADAERVVLDDGLRAEVAALGTFSLVGRDDTVAALRSAPCGGEDGACAAARGRHAGATAVVVASWSGGDGGAAVTVALVDVETALERNRVTTRVSRGVRPAAHESVVRLLAPERYVGRLRVELSVPDAEVLVDGVAVARTPMLAAVPAAPARHEVEVRAAGFSPYRAFLDVPFEEVVTLAIEPRGDALVPVTAATTPAGGSADGAAAASPSRVPLVPFLVGGAVSAAAGGAALVTGGAFALVAFDIKARWDRGAASDSEVRTNQVLGPLSGVLLGAGAVAVAAGAALVGASFMLAQDADERQ